MPLSEQEQRCVAFACRYLNEHYGGHWSIQKNLDDLKLSEPTPEVIVGNGIMTAAVEVKRVVDFASRDYIAFLRNNERVLTPSCGGSYYLCPALGFSLPMSSSLQRLVKKEIERVAPTLSPGQKGAVRIPRQGHISLISSSVPPFITCLHGGPYSELMSSISERISGQFTLIDDGLEHSFITQECKDDFEEAVVAACNRSLEGDSGDFKWEEEWELVRTDKDDDSSHDGVWVLATTGAQSMQASVEQCVHAALDNAFRKFRKTPPWAEVQVIVLEASSMAPASLAASAVKTFQSQDKELINHFLIVEGEDVKEASAIVASLEREAEAERQRQQKHILESPVSKGRVQRFEDDYLKARREIGATEKVFRYYGAFQHKTMPNHLASFGFNTLFNKGPFVDGSNWLDLRGWEFAVTEERYLLQKLHDCLAESINRTGQILPGTVAAQPEKILDTAKGLADLLGERRKSLIVIAAHLDIDAIVSLEKALTTPRWELADELRTNRILGKYEDCPVLHLNDQDTKNLYIVDIPRFASLIQYDPPVDLQVSALGEVTARRMVKDNPDLKLDVNTLLSMVHLTLYQSYEIQVHDQKAVWAAKFST
ncbi:hypothetical protein C1G86_0936 [Dehalococcoides mccartyi]|uniref:Uncharacterized protein n=1 Tax=Dehalococcoides mccartyi TaxID=61435 RepID=A0A328EPI9_9CHLR|nr:hypothetical protein C1G86_0936 [Dehalococcoides mccartyi]